MKECTNDECGMRQICQKRRGVSGGVKELVWWSTKRDELLGMAAEKR